MTEFWQFGHFGSRVDHWLARAGRRHLIVAILGVVALVVLVRLAYGLWGFTVWVERMSTRFFRDERRLV